MRNLQISKIDLTEIINLPICTQRTECLSELSTSEQMKEYQDVHTYQTVSY